MSYITDYTPLQSIALIPFPVYASISLEQTARGIARQCTHAYTFLSSLFHITPQFTLLVLTPEDWPSYTTYPFYGMPHAYPEKLVVAGQSNDFWRGLVPDRATVSSEYYQLLESVYGTAEDTIDIAPFFQLLALHELGHIFHQAVPYAFPRLWLMELFANLCLYTYIAEQEPQLLPILDTLPLSFLISNNSQPLSYASLRDFEHLYSDMAPSNYLWYQGHFHRIAKRVYEIEGISALHKLWITFIMPDEHVLTLIREGVSPELARLFEMWPASVLSPNSAISDS